MRTELELFVKEQEKLTGIKILFYTEDGKLVAGEGDAEILPIGITAVYSDAQSERTYFPIVCKGKKYIGIIAGAGDNERVNATLIKCLAENTFTKDLEINKTDFLKRVLFGEISYTQYKRYSERHDISETPCFAMLITMPSGKMADVLEVLYTYGNEKTDCIIKLHESECAFIKFNDKISDAYSSATEYAEYLSRYVYEETGVELSLYIGGTAKTPFELSASFAQAMETRRMGEAVGAQGGIHSFKEFVLVKILEELPKYKLNEYLSILAQDSAEEIFGDAEMVETADVFLENNLNVSETARILFLHRNTLTYRLDKIEKQTGLNVRKFSDAVTFRLITVLLKLIK